LLNGPGNDLVAVTALAAAGCQLILFTTGRGTPLGSPVPVVKVSTNSALAQMKSAWIDFDAGRILNDSPGLDSEFYAHILRICEGTLTASEKMNARDISILRDGVTL
nr:UxaA family hydrolase [Candidatus Limiplasma sp.]